MKILYITNMYPNAIHPYYGIFVKEQIEAIYRMSPVDYKIYFIEGYKSKIEYLKSIFMINILILKWNPDVIHVHYGLSGLFLLFNPWINSKTVITLHGGDINDEQGNKVQNFLTTRIIKAVNKVYTMNTHMQKRVIKINPNAEILPCGVDTTQFLCKNIYKHTNRKDFLVVFPGNPDRVVKDFPLFEKIMVILQDKYTEYNISFRVVHNLERHEVNLLLCTANCLVMTSKSEGSPQIIKEALACDLPIVSVDVGDVKMVLKDVKHCFVSESRSPKELAEHISKIIEQPHVRTNGRIILNQLNLSNEIIAARLLSHYKSIAE